MSVATTAGCQHRRHRNVALLTYQSALVASAGEADVAQHVEGGLAAGRLVAADVEDVDAQAVGHGNRSR